MNPPTRSEISGLAVPSMVSGLNFAGADRRVQRFGHPETRALHGAEVEGDRLGPVPVDDAFQLRAQVVEAGVPRGVLQPAVDPHPRSFQTVGVVVQLRQRPTLGAGVPLRERVVLVAVNAEHLISFDIDEDSADGRADTAEATHRLHTAITYSPPSEKQHCIFENDCTHSRMQFP